MLKVRWPQYRPSPFDNVFPESSLGAAWAFTAGRIEEIRQALELGVDENVHSIAISGSMARMEAHEASDIDLLVVVDDRLSDCNDKQRRAIFNKTWDSLQKGVTFEVTPPKPGGVFSTSVSMQQLLAADVRGRVDEGVTSYGQRMQLLIDAQPVWNDSQFESAHRDLLRWFCQHEVSQRFGQSSWQWLRHEVWRYWHSIAARAFWLSREDRRRNDIINVKLRHSRATLIAAFLAMIENGRGEIGDEVERVSAARRYTPLEFMCQLATTDSPVFFDAYETCWHNTVLLGKGSLSDQQAREVLTASETLQQLLGHLY